MLLNSIEIIEQEIKKMKQESQPIQKENQALKHQNDVLMRIIAHTLSQTSHELDVSLEELLNIDIQKFHMKATKKNKKSIFSLHYKA